MALRVITAPIPSPVIQQEALKDRGHHLVYSRQLFFPAGFSALASFFAGVNIMAKSNY